MVKNKSVIPRAINFGMSLINKSIELGIKDKEYRKKIIELRNFIKNNNDINNKNKYINDFILELKKDGDFKSVFKSFLEQVPQENPVVSVYLEYILYEAGESQRIQFLQERFKSFGFDNLFSQIDNISDINKSAINYISNYKQRDYPNGVVLNTPINPLPEKNGYFIINLYEEKSDGFNFINRVTYCHSNSNSLNEKIVLLLREDLNFGSISSCGININKDSEIILLDSLCYSVKNDYILDHSIKLDYLLKKTLQSDIVSKYQALFILTIAQTVLNIDQIKEVYSMYGLKFIDGESKDKDFKGSGESKDEDFKGSGKSNKTRNYPYNFNNLKENDVYINAENSSGFRVNHKRLLPIIFREGTSLPSKPSIQAIEKAKDNSFNLMAGIGFPGENKIIRPENLGELFNTLGIDFEQNNLTDLKYLESLIFLALDKINTYGNIAYIRYETFVSGGGTSSENVSLVRSRVKEITQQ